MRDDLTLEEVFPKNKSLVDYKNRMESMLDNKHDDFIEILTDFNPPAEIAKSIRKMLLIKDIEINQLREYIYKLEQKIIQITVSENLLDNFNYNKPNDEYKKKL